MPESFHMCEHNDYYHYSENIYFSESHTKSSAKPYLQVRCPANQDCDDYYYEDDYCVTTWVKICQRKDQNEVSAYSHWCCLLVCQCIIQ